MSGGESEEDHLQYLVLAWLQLKKITMKNKRVSGIEKLGLSTCIILIVYTVAFIRSSRDCGFSLLHAGLSNVGLLSGSMSAG